ncbi:MAG: DUF2235 domain-containing protein [Desulfobacteraceae bacterium]|jgi:hypothetical protein
MALYAFDGTWNLDEVVDTQDTNVVRFKELYMGNNAEYMEGIGTRFGKLGRVLGGLLGSGGRTRIEEMYEELCENCEQGDQVIDIIGFSRGAALALHFANEIGEKGVKLSNGKAQQARVRFLGLWDVVGSFGLSFDTIINFQEINLGWNIDTVHKCVDQCFHAMALDERRETFNVTRLDPDHKFDNIREVWFRGVHSDIGGGNRNEARSNIALQWMIAQGQACGLPLNDRKAQQPRYSHVNRFAPISENKDVKIDPRRKTLPGDEIDSSAQPLDLAVGESHTCEVLAESKYNWSGVVLRQGAKYTFSVPEGDTWDDAGITCGPAGWESEELPWYKEFIVNAFEKKRRLKNANWFALTGALKDEDDELFLIGDSKDPYTATHDADLYLFANDMLSRYHNNAGSLMVTITRTA